MKIVHGLFIILITALMIPHSADAGGTTRHFRIDTAEELSEGTLDQVMVNSEGRVVSGRRTSRIELSDTAMVWSLSKGPDGEIYAGTGNNGIVLRLKGSSTESVIDTGELIVTAMAWDNEDNVYLATVPEGKIFTVKKGSIKKNPKEPVKARLLVKLPDADHVWSLVWDSKRRVLFAGTGPGGIIYSIDRQGNADVYFDAEQEHVMCLELEENGDILAGLSPGALLIRVTGPGKAEGVHDFNGTEVKAVVADGKRMFAAVNHFTTPPAPPSITVHKTVVHKPVPRPKPGTGEVWVLNTDGMIERLWKKKEGHVTAMAKGPDGLVYAGIGADGRLYGINPDTRESLTVLDLDERQILSMLMEGDEWIAGTGDAGSLYRVSAAAHSQAGYLTEALDAGFIARWGRVEWKNTAGFSVRARTGNTKKPDQTWSSWTTLGSRPGSRLKSADSRYLQLGFRWKKPDAVLDSIRVFYRPVNQRARVTGLEAEAKFRRKSTGGKTVSKSISHVRNNTKDDKTVEGPDQGQERTSILDLKWKVDNADDDEVVYFLAYRMEGDEGWIGINDEKNPVRKTTYEWDTEAVPSGYYEIGVTVSDAEVWPKDEALEDEYVSPPVLVDNQPPAILGMSVRNSIVSGRVVDDLGPVDRVEFSVDGGPWRPVPVSGGLMDSARLEFSFPVPDDAGEGPHVVAVRAADLAGNISAGRAKFRVGRK